MVQLHRAAHAFLLDDQPAFAAHAGAAFEKFRACGDAGYGTLAATHVVAAEVATRGGQPEGRPLVAIARHIRGSGSLSYGLGLCYLLARTGPHWAAAPGRP